MGLRLFAPLGVMFTVLFVAGGGGVRADTPTPSPSLVTTPETTVVLPSPEATTMIVPTVEVEQATAQPSSQLSPEPTTTAVPVATPTLPSTPSSETTVAATPSPVPVPTPIPINAAPPSVILPSPDQLRLDARLRWGERVPASVRRWAFLIVPAAHRYGVNPNLIAAVMTMESDGDPLAWNSGSDARGLMQVLHGPWDPKQNIDLGTSMLAGFLNQFNDLTLALAAYNAGPNAVLAYHGVPPYRETQDYVVVVSYLYDLFNHHLLTPKRRAQYRSTLKDLQRFADQRPKVKRLARLAHVSIGSDVNLTCRHFRSSCTVTRPIPVFPTHDPFWPIAGAPDPLEHVDVVPVTGTSTVAGR